MKKFFSFLLAIALIVVLVACGGEEQVSYSKLLDSYLLNQSNVLSSNEILLDSQLKVGDQTYELTWTSSSEYAKIAETAVDGSYKVTITKPETGVADVTFTVKLGDATKAFEGFLIKAIEVYDFVDAYVFKQNKATISSDFELDTEFTKWNKTATITWTSLSELVKISDDGKKAEITGTSVETPAKVKATFTYNGEISNKTFEFTIFEQMDNDEQINYWYSNTGISQTLSGYVVSVATVYAATFNNISFYMIDDSFKAGYYCYRTGIDAENAALLVSGAHVTVSGTTNTCYNGLYETNAGGTVVVDTNIPAIDPLTKVVDFDSYLTSQTPSARYYQSTLIKLNGWKITEKTAAPTRSANTNILKIERDGISISVRVTKYMEGFFSPWADPADPKFDAIVTMYEGLAVGDYIDITGILGNGNGHEINVIGAEYIVKSTAPAAETEGKALAESINSVVIPSKTKTATEIDLPQSSENITITWDLKESAVAKIEEGKLVITPTDEETKVQLTGVYTNGNFSTKVYYSTVAKAELVEAQPISIADAKKLAKNAEALVEGTIMAISSRGYILYDGTAAVYVYSQNATVEAERNHGYAIGDTVRISGKLDYYNVVELVPESSKKVEITAQQLPTITPYDAKAIADYVAAGGAFDQVYVEITGTLSISGNYYNVQVSSDANAPQASLSYMLDALKTSVNGMDGKKVTIKGYAIGHSSNKFMNIIVLSCEVVTE